MGRPALTLIESVRCLDCGAIYAKPAGGGTVQANPGCPDCGYLGWLPVAVAVTGEISRRRSFSSLLLRRLAQSC